MNIRRNLTNRDWTKVPGWDDARKEYVELDCERWIRENGIREAGQENGKMEYPLTDAVQPDEIYTKILAWVNQRGKDCHAAVSKYLNSQRHALTMETQEGTAPIQHQVEGLREQGIVELRDQLSDDRTYLAQKEREVKEAWTGLLEFKNASNLKRVAEYDQQDSWYWWLVCIVVIEAVVNAFMLAGVHQYGLLGALTAMITIGLVNAGFFGWIIGDGWRLKNSVIAGTKTGGWSMVVLGAMAMVAWNLLVGHFRDSMLSITSIAASGESSLRELLTDNAMDRLLDDPFGLESMQSWVLAVIGIACCFFASSKWFKRDDVYPRYGSISRAATKHNEEYWNEVKERRTRLKDIYERYIDRIRDLRQQIENRKGNHMLITDMANEIVRQFPMQLRRYQNDLDFIIAAYRSANEKARTTPSPQFFKKKLTVDLEMLETPPWQGIPAPEYDQDWEGFQRAEDRIRSIYIEVQKGYPTLDELMNGKRSELKLIE